MVDLSVFFKEESVRMVTKRNKTQQKFNEEKIYRWGEYAARHGIDWKYMAEATIARLPMNVTTEEIHKTMIQVCLDKEDLPYSRVAARLLYAELRGYMRQKGISDKSTFKDIHSKLKELGLWTEVVYVPEMEEQYSELYSHRLEYWQIRQWMDKYSLRIHDIPVETPHMAALAIGHTLHGNTQEAFNLALGIITGKINLPTPALNGIRNGDFDTISCSVMEGGDSVASIGVADHLAYRMTAKKAGIGIMFNTRSIGNEVKGGAVEHLGKLPIYASVDKSVKMFTQVSRGGAATVTFNVYDPEVMNIIMVKSQRTPENKRIDKLDYSMSYDDNFLQQVLQDGSIQTISITGVKGDVYKARDILKTFLTVRKETGRLYCFNLTEANRHTPFLDEIKQSNLCMEIALPTKEFTGMEDLYSDRSEGEMAFCTLAAINVSKVSKDEYPQVARTVVSTLNKLINKVSMFAPSLKTNLLRRRSLGVGITGLAGLLHKMNTTYNDAEYISIVAEQHYFNILKASQDLVEEFGEISGVDLNWLPVDTRKTDYTTYLDWESLRGKPRCNSVLVAHMPTESSAVFSDATNGLYPVRNRIINKLSRKGSVQYISPNVAELAWDIDNITLTNAYAAVQGFTDQGISADYYVPSGKVSMAQMMQEWVAQARSGVKSMYYLNTNDSNGGMFEEEGCTAGCKL